MSNWHKSKWLVLCFVATLLSLLLSKSPAPVYALGTPQITSVSPSSPSPVGTCISVRARVDWDSEFRSMRMRFGNEGWQEEATPEFERTFCTDHLSPGWYTIRVEVARQGDNSWSSPTVAEASYELTAGSSPQPPQSPSEPPAGPSISQINFYPSSAQVGDNVGVHIKVNSSNLGAVRLTPSCGDTAHREHTAPEFDTTWYTDTCGSGWQDLRVCARHVDDPDWENLTCSTASYHLDAPPAASVPGPIANFWADDSTIQQGNCTSLHWSTANASSVDIDGNGVDTSGDWLVCPAITKHYSLRATGPGGDATRNVTVAVTAGAPQPDIDIGAILTSFSTGDVIRIASEIYVIYDGQRRHVPNPDTLDALGLGQDRIDNKGFSEEELFLIPRGSDIPDVNRDEQGFAAFKSEVFPYTTPIIPGDNTSSSNSNCPSAGARLAIGDIAVVSDSDPYPIRARSQPGLSSSILFQVPVYGQVSIVSGPVCADGHRWWEVGYQGKGGWSSEVGPSGDYNLVPNGTPLPSSGESALPNPHSEESGGSCPGAQTPRMTVGEVGRVTYGGGSVSLRAAPQSPTVRQSLSEGFEFTVIGGPVCTVGQEGHLNWWEVKLDSGTTGWVSEGYKHTNYWIEPVSAAPNEASANSESQTNLEFPEPDMEPAPEADRSAEVDFEAIPKDVKGLDLFDVLTSCPQAVVENLPAILETIAFFTHGILQPVSPPPSAAQSTAECLSALLPNTIDEFVLGE